MKTDSEIQKNVIEELKWEPSLKPSEIGVAVKNGVVTLSGTLDSYTKKIAAEKAAKRVSGVKAVAEDIEVKYPGSLVKSDSQLAEAVTNALKWHAAFQQDKIKIKVEDGVVTFDGEVDWEFQRNSARLMVENITGVKGINNRITLKPQPVSKDVKRKIISAFQRHASIDAEKVDVEIEGSTVTLTGTVRSFTEKRDAENAVWGAAGVTKVVNKIEVESGIFAM